MMSLAAASAQLSAASARRLIWRHPEWWSVALSIAAWIAMLSTPPHPPSHRTAAADMMSWLLMVAATMFPLVIAQVRQAAFHSLWNRRNRAAAIFLTGYAVTWLAFGALVILARRELDIGARPSLIIAILVAAAWHVSPWKRRALGNCHRIVPLAPRGWRANWDCLRFGWRIGAACVGTCWALMLVCAASDHSVWAMCFATIVAIHDRTSVAGSR